MDRMFHTLWYVNLYVDCAVNIMFGIWVIHGPSGPYTVIFGIWVIYGSRDPEWVPGGGAHQQQITFLRPL